MDDMWGLPRLSGLGADDICGLPERLPEMSGLPGLWNSLLADGSRMGGSDEVFIGARNVVGLDVGGLLIIPPDGMVGVVVGVARGVRVCISPESRAKGCEVIPPGRNK